jgi:hypothetical protein
MIKYKGAYEILSPDYVVLFRSNEYGIILGKLR